MEVEGCDLEFDGLWFDGMGRGVWAGEVFIRIDGRRRAVGLI